MLLSRLPRRPVVAARVAMALVFAAGPAAAEPSWLPTPVEEGAAQQLADRLLALGDTSSDAEQVLGGAREMLRRMRDAVDAWGAEGARRRAPEFAGLSLPGAARPSLFAMGAWSVCNLDLYLAYDEATRTGDAGAALAPALGLTAVTLVILRLREPFLGEGGAQPEIEAHLTSPEFEALLASIQSTPPLRAAVREGCAPALGELLAGPLDYLRGRAPAE
jgi:hypothetical protein